MLSRDLRTECQGKVANKPKIESEEEIKIFKVLQNSLQVDWNRITVENSCLGTEGGNLQKMIRNT